MESSNTPSLTGDDVSLGSALHLVREPCTRNLRCGLDLGTESRSFIRSAYVRISRASLKRCGPQASSNPFSACGFLNSCLFAFPPTKRVSLSIS